MTDALHRQLADLRFDALEAHRLQFSRQLNALEAGEVHRVPESRAWSLAQIGEHLLRIDRGLDLAGTQATALARVRSRLGSMILCGVLSLPVRIPAPPSAQSVMPSEAPSWPEVREAWAALRSSWRTVLRDISPGSIVYHHPLAGPLCRDDALAFLLAHHRHHDAQVERTLRQLRRGWGDQRTTTTGRERRTPPTSATSA